MTILQYCRLFYRQKIDKLKLKISLSIYLLKKGITALAAIPLNNLTRQVAKKLINQKAGIRNFCNFYILVIEARLATHSHELFSSSRVNANRAVKPGLGHPCLDGHGKALDDLTGIITHHMHAHDFIGRHFHNQFHEYTGSAAT